MENKKRLMSLCGINPYMMETKFTKEEYEELIKRADEIIKAATKDIILWTEMKKVCENAQSELH